MKRSLEALNEVLSDRGERLPGTSVIPGGVRGVAMDAWRDRFFARLGDSRAADATRQAWSRGKKGLVAKHIIGMFDPWVWLVTERDRHTMSQAVTV
jgi:hypothetical protein